MAITSRTEFAAAINQVAAERGIDVEVVLEGIKSAILAAYKKDSGSDVEEEVTLDLNPETGEVKVFEDGKDVTPAGFGRIAAQTAKQVILQKIREAEKSAILDEFGKRVGTVVSGLIQRVSPPVVIINLGKAEGIMPPSEQVPQEDYVANKRMMFFIKEVKEGTRGEEIIVSRKDPGLLVGLFKREVPEMASGAVEIKSIAREAGSRSKVGVWSNQPGVDPVGSCVGQKGVRVQNIISEIDDEKIDIVSYSEDPQKFIANSLSPAKEIVVRIKNKEEKETEAIVPDDQLSLAIGKDGQNVRLAHKLTGWRIDIKGKSEEGKKSKKSTASIKKAAKTKAA